MREGKGFLISCDKYFRMVWEKSKFERKAFVHYPPQKKSGLKFIRDDFFESA